MTSSPQLCATATATILVAIAIVPPAHLVQRHICVNHKVLCSLAAQAPLVVRALWVQRGAAVDVVAQVMLAHHLDSIEREARERRRRQAAAAAAGGSSICIDERQPPARAGDLGGTPPRLCERCRGGQEGACRCAAARTFRTLPFLVFFTKLLDCSIVPEHWRRGGRCSCAAGQELRWIAPAKGSPVSSKAQLNPSNLQNTATTGQAL